MLMSVMGMGEGEWKQLFGDARAADDAGGRLQKWRHQHEADPTAAFFASNSTLTGK